MPSKKAERRGMKRDTDRSYSEGSDTKSSKMESVVPQVAVSLQATPSSVSIQPEPLKSAEQHVTPLQTEQQLPAAASIESEPLLPTNRSMTLPSATANPPAVSLQMNDKSKKPQDIAESQLRFHATTPPSLQELLKHPTLSLSPEKQVRYVNALILNEYLTLDDLKKATLDIMIKYCGIPAADAQKIHDLLHPLPPPTPATLEELDAMVKNLEDASADPFVPRKGARLSQLFRMCNEEKLHGAIRGAAIKASDVRGLQEKSNIPLPTIVGTMGQGKTEVLQWIVELRTVKGESLRDVFINAMNTNKPENVLDVKHIVTLFATFNQGTFYDDSEGGVKQSLQTRLLCSYRKKKWNMAKVRTEMKDLPCLLEYVRKQEALRLGLKDSAEIMVILCIDEIRKLGDARLRSELLDEICKTASSEAESRLPFLPIVSCLDLGSIFTAVTSSGRPLHNILLEPCIPEDVETLGNQLVSEIPQTSKADDYRREALFALDSCGGHFRSLERVAQCIRLYQTIVIDTQVMNDYAPAALEILAQTMKHSASHTQYLAKETDMYGKVFGEKEYTLLQLQDVQPDSGVVYKYVDATARFVTPFVVPAALYAWARGPKEKADPKLQGFSQLLACFDSSAMREWRTLIKEWERGMPQAELLHVALRSRLGGGAGSNRLTMKDIYGDDGCVGSAGELRWNTSAKEGNFVIDDAAFQGIKTISEQRAKVKEVFRAVQRNVIVILTPSVENYPGIECVHNIFRVPVLTQNKMYEKATANMVLKWAAAAHHEMNENLQFAGKGHVVLYVTGISLDELKSIAPLDKKTAGHLDPNTTVVTIPGLERLLMPLGRTCLLTLLREKKGHNEQGT